MKNSLVILSLVFTFNSFAQNNYANVQFEGPAEIILKSNSPNTTASGKLSSGENIKIQCDHGACYFLIEYKGKKVSGNVGDTINNLTIYEYDMADDGDKEIVIVNEFMDTAYLFIYSYGRGMTQKIFEKKIGYYKTVIKSNYIEFYMPSGLDQLWAFYMGNYYEMQPVKLSDY